MAKVTQALRDKLLSLVNSMGYEFVGCETLSQGRGSSTLRIFIDNKQGITVTDCSKVSRQVSAMLDVEDPVSSDYTLEISSPGLNRPLFEPAHYHNQIGQRIKVRVYTPINKRRNFTGILVSADENKIRLLGESSEEIIFSFSDIEKANIVADI